MAPVRRGQGDGAGLPRAGGSLPSVAIVSSAHEVAGAEVYLLALLEALAARMPIEVLASDRAPAELHRRARAAGARTATVRGLARRPDAAALARLVRALRRRRPDLVHVNLSDQGDGLVGLAAARLAGLPVTATLHIVLPERRAALERLSRVALRRARTVIGVSDAVGRYLADQGIEHVVVRNGVAPPEPVPGARAALGLGPSDFAVGGIGRLDPQKGWDVLCRAAERLRERVPGVRLVVVGDGPERAALEAIAPPEVRFAGYRERAAGLVGAFDVLAVPSRYEGFGLVAVEAMLSGVPVVASGVGGLPEVVGDAGLLVAPDDPEALAGALAAVALDAALRERLRGAGRERAGRLFAGERMAEETLAVWREATGAIH